MDEHCKYCTQPRKPRSDRPGKFFTLCEEHQAEYRRQKSKESYYRNQEDRIERSRKWRLENPEKAKAQSQAYYSKPENKERKRKYMETYLRPWREHLKDSCERCNFVAKERRQLDIHHKDGNKNNNDPSNLETLCPPCHRMIDHTGLA